MKPQFYWLSPKLEVRETDRYGKGTFAKRELRKGERLLVFAGYVLPLTDEENLPAGMGDSGIQIAEDLSLCATKKEELGGINFVNHSCEPNAGIRGQVFLVAMRRIKAGEEVTFDYAMTLAESKSAKPYRLQCHCGSKICRGMITDRDWRKRELQERYEGYFQSYLQERINRQRMRGNGGSHVIKEVRIEIKPSTQLKGEVGVFATRNMVAGSLVVEAAQFQVERFVAWERFDELDDVTKAKVNDYCSGDENGFYAPPDLNYLSIAWHLNHSCDPNIGFDRGYNFVAMRNIERGEELCWDYAYDESNPNFKMKCGCGSKKCRGVITGNDWRFLVEDKEIWPYLSSDIRRLATTSGIGSSSIRTWPRSP